MATNYAARVPVPPGSAINGGLNPCGTDNMLRIFGRPGALSTNCTPILNDKLKKLLVTKNVGPFTVTGLKPAVAALQRIFAKVQQREPELYKAIKTAGMLCCRAIRGSTRTYSIHSFGCAIDLYCGSGVVPLGTPQTHVGVFRLYPFFFEERFFWGAEFSRKDAMHFETSRELIQEWERKGWLK